MLDPKVDGKDADGKLESGVKRAETRRKNAAVCAELGAENDKLKAENDKLNAKTERLKAENDKLKVEADKRDNRIEDLEEQNRILTEVIKLANSNTEYVQGLRDRQLQIPCNHCDHDLKQDEEEHEKKLLEFNTATTNPISPETEPTTERKTNYYKAHLEGKLNLTGNAKDDAFELMKIEHELMMEKANLPTELANSEKTFSVVKSEYDKAAEIHHDILKRPADLREFEAELTRKRFKLVDDALSTPVPASSKDLEESTASSQALQVVANGERL